MTGHRRHKNAPLKADQRAASSWAHLQPQLDDGTTPERRVSAVDGYLRTRPETRAPGYRAAGGGRTLRRCAGGVQGCGAASPATRVVVISPSKERSLTRVGGRRSGAGVPAMACPEQKGDPMNPLSTRGQLD